MVFWAQNQQRTHHKVGTARPPKAIHTAIYAEGACPYTHRATHNRHAECVGLPWWSFGSRRAQIVCRRPKLPWLTEPGQRPNLPHGGRRSEVAARAQPKTPKAPKNAI